MSLQACSQMPDAIARAATARLPFPVRSSAHADRRASVGRGATLPPVFGQTRRVLASAGFHTVSIQEPFETRKPPPVLDKTGMAILPVSRMMSLVPCSR